MSLIYLLCSFPLLIIPFLLNFRFLRMTYKVIYDLTPIGYVLDFISCRYNLSSLPTATQPFCLILKHPKFIPPQGLCTCYFLSVMLIPSYVHDWILLALEISFQISPSLTTFYKMSPFP